MLLFNQLILVYVKYLIPWEFCMYRNNDAVSLCVGAYVY